MAGNLLKRDSIRTTLPILMLEQKFGSLDFFNTSLDAAGFVKDAGFGDLVKNLK
ncbi:MAG: hypothetical protein LBJ67_05945 [Planctomycetaceae bacterium]|jgi:hypothetical protein|nr:hypothetical protein [Planctomycetaceae bacterium]